MSSPVNTPASPIYFQSFYISQKFVFHMYTDIHCKNSPMDFNADQNTYIKPTP